MRRVGVIENKKNYKDEKYIEKIIMKHRQLKICLFFYLKIMKNKNMEQQNKKMQFIVCVCVSVCLSVCVSVYIYSLSSSTLPSAPIWHWCLRPFCTGSSQRRWSGLWPGCAFAVITKQMKKKCTWWNKSHNLHMLTQCMYLSLYCLWALNHRTGLTAWQQESRVPTEVLLD